MLASILLGENKIYINIGVIGKRQLRICLFKKLVLIWSFLVRLEKLAKFIDFKELGDFLL